MSAHAAAGGVPAAGRSESIVACTVGSDQFAMRGGDACEIARAESMRRQPGVDGSVGILYVNRDRVPVYALGAVLGRPATAGGNHVVVTRGANGMIGWLVDRIARPTLDEAVHVIPLPAIVGDRAVRWFEGLVRLGDRSLLLISPPSLDPREAPHAAALPDDRAPALAGTPARPGDEVTAPLVLLFSSRALPGCRAGRFALSARRVEAVIRAQPITVVPGSAAHVTGVIVWRDVAIAVVDVRDERDRRAAAPDERVVVARCGGSLNGTLVAFPVDADVALHQPTRADREVEDPDTAAPPFVAGVFTVAGSPVALLNLDAAVAALAG